MSMPEAGKTMVLPAMTAQIIEIQPLRSGWQVRGIDSTLTPPFFTGPSAFECALADAWENTGAHSGEIRVLARHGKVLLSIPFGRTREQCVPDAAVGDRASARALSELAL